MKLTPKLALVFISFATVLLLGVGALVYSSGRTALEAATLAELQSTSLEKSAALDTWIAERKSDISALSHSPAILDELAIVFRSGEDTSSAYDRLIQELSVRTGQGQPYLTFLILSPDTGEILIATNPREEGKFREDRDYFIQGKITPFVSKVYYSLELQGPAITASAPLRTEDGQLLGVLAGRLNLHELNTIIQRRSGLHQTDDAFLVNTSNFFVTQPHLLSDPAVLQRGIHTEAVRQCTTTRSNGTLSALDYRDVLSIITYRWLPEHEMCLIVKMDRDEALAPIDGFGRAIVWIALSAFIAASALAFVLSRGLIRPILVLQTTVQGFGRGHLDIRLPETRSDELGVLASEFNQMAAALAEKERELRIHAATLEQRIQERTRELQDSNTQLSRAQEIAHLGSWELDLVKDQLTWSDEVYRIFGLQPQEFSATYEAFLEAVHPEDRAAVDATYSGSIQVGRDSYEIEHRVVRGSTGEVRIVHEKCEHFRDQDGQIIRSVGMVHDITERKRAEEELHRTLEELKYSNAELEQFAYVASHDLQEPLRMVSSYMQLLAKRYQGKLDRDADEFIAFAVDGAKRMQNLINDLLTFSRVGTRRRTLVSTSCEDAMEEAISNLQIAIEESGAIITHESLPQVKGDPTQLVQLFQNLLGNAIKFRGSEPARIHVGVRREESEWIFRVCDNGIGIDRRFAERIFVIFQRLHDRDSYPGTGIGLAICKRIVQRHGGCIWVESQPGKGATFYFTLPSKETV
jgi:PAS domain S-box-containing protein